MMLVTLFIAHLHILRRAMRRVTVAPLLLGMCLLFAQSFAIWHSTAHLHAYEHPAHSALELRAGSTTADTDVTFLGKAPSAQLEFLGLNHTEGDDACLALQALVFFAVLILAGYWLSYMRLQRCLPVQTTFALVLQRWHALPPARAPPR